MGVNNPACCAVSSTLCLTSMSLAVPYSGVRKCRAAVRKEEDEKKSSGQLRGKEAAESAASLISGRRDFHKRRRLKRIVSQVKKPKRALPQHYV